jgi:hypothetical protein
MRYLYAVQLAFTLWMLLDAYRRQHMYWFWFVLFVPIVGPCSYFLFVKVRVWQARLSDWWSARRPPSLEMLRYEAEQAPTLARDLALAEALIGRKRHGEAIPHLYAALEREPEHCQVLYLLALCRTEQGHPEEALPLLEQIIERDRHWSSYAAWRLLITARAQNGEGLKALAACRELVRLAPTIQFQSLLAERLMVEGMTDEAQQVLEEALEAYRYSPGPLRRRNRRWARQARRLLSRATKATYSIAK